MNDLAVIVLQLTVWALPLIFAITFHEVAHGWTANRLGDDTAKRMGRITLNPVRHIDPLGTIILPGILILGAVVTGTRPLLFGWAKPVPVNFGRLRRPKRDMVLVALAGPAINILLGIAAAAAMHLVVSPRTVVSLWLWENLENFLLLNISLACFNMLPILPLDGGRVLTGLLPLRWAIPFARTERFGLLVVMGLIIIVPMLGQQLGLSWNPLSAVLLPVLSLVYSLILALTGWA